MCVCLSVCLSVKSHLTSGASLRPENTVTYSAGNEGQKICVFFSETAPLQRSSTAPLKAYVRSAIFLQKARMRIIYIVRGFQGSCTRGAEGSAL